MDDEKLASEQAKQDQLQYALCSWVKEDGTVCGSPAQRESELCYHHGEHRRRRRKIYMSMLGKAKVLEPYMSGAAAGKDPVTHRVFDGLFADLLHELALPPLDSPDEVNVALTNILQMVGTQQADPKLTRQMLYACRVAVSNHQNAIRMKWRGVKKLDLKEAQKITVEETEKMDSANGSEAGPTVASGQEDVSTENQNQMQIPRYARNDNSSVDEADVKSPEGTTDGSPAWSETSGSEVERECRESETTEPHHSAEGGSGDEVEATFTNEEIDSMYAEAEKDLGEPAACKQEPAGRRDGAVYEARERKAAVINAAKEAAYLASAMARQDELEEKAEHRRQIQKLLKGELVDSENPAKVKGITI